jgi:hypothetical protein
LARIWHSHPHKATYRRAQLHKRQQGKVENAEHFRRSQHLDRRFE